jgi:hypothetical protein
MEVPMDGDPWVWAITLDLPTGSTKLVVLDYVTGDFIESWSPAP